MTNTTSNTIHIIVHSTGRALFDAYHGKRRLTRSRTPFFSAARILLNEGIPEDTIITMSHAGSGTVALSSTVGLAGRLSLTEDDRRGFRLRAHRPFPGGRGVTKTGADEPWATDGPDNDNEPSCPTPAVPCSPLVEPVRIYVDGACQRGRGGFAAIIVTEADEMVLSGEVEGTTGMRMKLTAAVRALEEVELGLSCIIWTDLDYLARGMTEWLPIWKANGWQGADGKPVANQDLWRRLDAAADGRAIQWDRRRAEGELALRAKATAQAEAGITGETALNAA